MITIHVRKPYSHRVSKKRILYVVENSLREIQPNGKLDLSVIICSDPEIISLNTMYRQINHPTDVLSFANNEYDPDTQSKNLGDIVISFDTASIQAKQANNDLQTEIDMLVIHGLLHLLGFDHNNEINKNNMWKNQYKLHEKLGIAAKFLPGENA